MAKDDYFVIVYQILSYMYQQLKAGKDVDPKMLQAESPLFQINKRYWGYIIYMLQESGLIANVGFYNVGGMPHPQPHDFNNCYITPKGIEYLLDNSFMEKAKRFLKEVKEIVPFT